MDKYHFTINSELVFYNYSLDQVKSVSLPSYQDVLLTDLIKKLGSKGRIAYLEKNGYHSTLLKLPVA